MHLVDVLTVGDSAQAFVDASGILHLFLVKQEYSFEFFCRLYLNTDELTIGCYRCVHKE